MPEFKPGLSDSKRLLKGLRKKVKEIANPQTSVAPTRKKVSDENKLPSEYEDTRPYVLSPIPEEAVLNERISPAKERGDYFDPPTMFAERISILHVGGQRLLDFFEKTIGNKELFFQVEQIMQAVIVPREELFKNFNYLPALKVSTVKEQGSLMVSKTVIGEIVKSAGIVIDSRQPEQNMFYNETGDIIFTLDIVVSSTIFRKKVSIRSLQFDVLVSL